MLIIKQQHYRIGYLERSVEKAYSEKPTSLCLIDKIDLSVDKFPNCETDFLFGSPKM